MKISREKLYQIILEEYAIEEGVLDEALSPEKTAELIDWIKGKGPRPDWATDDYGSSNIGKGVQSTTNPDADRSADTMPLPADDMPQYDDEDIDDGGAYDPDAEAAVSEPHPVKAAVDGIYELVSDMDPEDVAEIFQIVFEKLPGVEMSQADVNPGTLYSPGAEGRPTVGFKEIKQLIRKILSEGHYHDMGGEGEMYDTLDPHGLNAMTDAELVDAAHKDGIEKIIVFDGEGDLANREEVIAALKDV